MTTSIIDLNYADDGELAIMATELGIITYPVMTLPNGSTMWESRPISGGFAIQSNDSPRESMIRSIMLMGVNNERVGSFQGH